VTSSRSCASAAVTPSAAARSFARAARSPAIGRPPANSVWLPVRPSVTVLGEAKIWPIAPKPSPVGQVCAAASAAARCSGVAPSGMFGAQSAGGRAAPPARRRPRPAWRSR
jgi:hypothetical protein